MFRIAVCDDSKHDLQATANMLEELTKYNIKYEVYTFDNGNSLIKEYKNGRDFQLLILDMVMEPINGIDTAKEIRRYDLSVPILIVTSTTEFALEGYVVNARRYITKPLNKEKFLREVMQIYELYTSEEDQYCIIRNDDGITKLKVDDILYFDSDRHTITAHTLDNTYSFRDTINNVEQQYAQYGFFRVHKSFVVNLKYVVNYSKKAATLINGEIIDVSKTRASSLHDALLDFASKTVSEIM